MAREEYSHLSSYYLIANDTERSKTSMMSYFNCNTHTYMLLLHEFHGLRRYFVYMYESNQVTICSTKQFIVYNCTRERKSCFIDISKLVTCTSAFFLSFFSALSCSQSSILSRIDLSFSFFFLIGYNRPGSLPLG